tara:strand:+ start:455 stop:691 length:237 start_codon:yes stop_codon:yes gene_type:complete
MRTLCCSYCSDEATGLDIDGEPTCGDAETCTEAADPLPLVVEVSSDDAGDEVGDDEGPEDPADESEDPAYSALVMATW